ncbi:hypothetical protein D3C77_649430 [compost metagenome]
MYPTAGTVKYAVKPIGAGLPSDSEYVSASGKNRAESTRSIILDDWGGQGGMT